MGITQMGDQILSLYVKRMTRRDIITMFKEMPDTRMLPILISKVTDTVKE